MANNHSGESFLAGFLIGGIIGAGVALLFAPASGKETRRFIQTQAEKAIDEGREEFEKVRNIIREEIVRLAESKEAFQQALHKGVETYKSPSETEEE
ncbi:YtxH domain-containing protein [bacterium]|nr:MAG: YtxH domain-containing protein [bacterium]